MTDAEPPRHEQTQGSGTRPTHLHELLGRSAAGYRRVIAELHACERQTAALIGDRAARAWSDVELGDYLALRHHEQQLRQRLRRIRRIFDRVRIRLRDLEGTP